jgi:hypothetical protein
MSYLKNMNNSKSRFKTVTPVMIYLTPEDKEALSKYALDNKMTASQIVREGVRMQTTGERFQYGVQRRATGGNQDCSCYRRRKDDVPFREVICYLGI